MNTFSRLYSTVRSPWTMIMLSRSGAFKLFGFELLDAPGSVHFQSFEKLLGTLAGAHYRAPERQSGDWERVNAASDVFSVGQMILSVYSEAIPTEMAKIQKKMILVNGGSRVKISQALESSAFQTPFVEAMLFLEQLALKSHAETSTFFKGLDKGALPQMASQTRIHSVLPALKETIDRALGPDRRPEDLRELVSGALPVLSEVGFQHSFASFVSEASKSTCRYRLGAPCLEKNTGGTWCQLFFRYFLFRIAPFGFSSWRESMASCGTWTRRRSTGPCSIPY